MDSVQIARHMVMPASLPQRIVPSLVDEASTSSMASTAMGGSASSRMVVAKGTSDPAGFRAADSLSGASMSGRFGVGRFKAAIVAIPFGPRLAGRNASEIQSIIESSTLFPGKPEAK